MTRILENIKALEASRILAEQGVGPNQNVTVIVEESLADIARRTREQARRRGMTDEIFQQLMQSR